jgi:holliday junction DNA helicase RuvB
MFDDDGLDALEAGAMYALYRHGQDRQTQQLIAAMRQGQQRPVDDDDEVHVDLDVDVHVHTDEDERGIAPVNMLDFATTDMLQDWDEFIGQEPLKKQIAVYMSSAKMRGTAMPHILLASGYPGVGKTTIARLIAKTLGVNIIELVPPFNIYTLVEAAKKLGDRDILFIDEIHKLADNGKRGAEILLKVLEERVAFLPDGEVVRLNDITVVGATTDRDKLPEPVVDRFKIKPYFQAYSLVELALISNAFADRHDLINPNLDLYNADIAVAISDACRGTPRIIEEMVLAQRDLSLHLGRCATEGELLAFLEVEPDGLTRTHIHYLTALYQYFPRMTKDETVEYIVGESAIMQILRETKQGIMRVEAFLVERGLIDRTPRGRRLTARGIQKAREFVAQGKGAADVA